MKKLIILLFSALSISLYSQTDLSTDNNLTGVYSQNKSGSQMQVNFQGSNSLKYKGSILDLQTNYALGYSPKLSQNELIQRTNLGRNGEYWDAFITHQFNYSLVREISSDNWTGIGGGVKKSKSWGKVSLSYAFILQNTTYFTDETSQKFRHSIRGKIKIEKKLFTISTEYFYQPNVSDPKDYIIYGTSKINILPKRPLSFVFQDVINYRSISSVNMIHNLTFGLSYKFNKKIEKKTKQRE